MSPKKMPDFGIVIEEDHDQGLQRIVATFNGKRYVCSTLNPGPGTKFGLWCEMNDDGTPGHPTGSDLHLALDRALREHRKAKDEKRSKR